MDADDNVKSGLKGLTLKTLKCLYTNKENKRVSETSQMPLLALSASFEYLCYGSTTVNIFTFAVRGSTLVVKIRF